MRIRRHFAGPSLNDENYVDTICRRCSGSSAHASRQRAEGELRRSGQPPDESEFGEILHNLLSESLWDCRQDRDSPGHLLPWAMDPASSIRLLDVAMERRTWTSRCGPFSRSSVRAVFMLLLLLIVVSTLGERDVADCGCLGCDAGHRYGVERHGSELCGRGYDPSDGALPGRGTIFRRRDSRARCARSSIFSTVITTTDNQTIYIPEQLDRDGDHRQLFDCGTSACGLDDRDLLRRRRGYGAGGGSGDTEGRSPDPSGPGTWRCGVAALADSSVNLTVRVWTRNEDYWNVLFEYNERYYKGFRGGDQLPVPADGRSREND